MYNYVDSSCFMVVFLKEKRCITGRHENARSGLLEQGNAEQTDLFSDTLFVGRTAEQSVFLQEIA